MFTFVLSIQTNKNLQIMKTKSEIKRWLKDIRSNQVEVEAKLNAATSNYQYEILHEEKMKWDTIESVLSSILGKDAA